jgi:hypothetical protein
MDPAEHGSGDLLFARARRFKDGKSVLAVQGSWGAAEVRPNHAKRGVPQGFDAPERANPAGLRSNFGDLINAAGLHIEPRSAPASGQDSQQMSAWTAQFFA